MKSGPIAPNQTYHFNEHKQLTDNTPESVRAWEAINQIDNEYLRDPLGHFQTIADAMRPPVAPNSPPYAIFEDQDSSHDTALVIALPYASSISPAISPGVTVDALHGKGKIDSNEWHNAEKHYALFRIMKALGITDAQGRSIPVITIAAPSKDWQPKFTKDDKEALGRGDFSPFAPYIQAILDKEDIGRVHLGGYSMGAAIGHSAMHNLTQSDILSATLGEPTNYKERSRGEMVKNYMFNIPTPPNNSGIKSDEK